MKDFSRYANGKDSARDKETKNNGGASGSGEINGSAFEMLKRIASKYEGASESELISAIMEEARRSRENGKLSDAEIESFTAAVSPMLSDKQRKQLNKVVEKIKKT